jgi:hypothetical protein
MNTIVLQTGSGMFHLFPPDAYSMEEDFSYKEQHENECYQFSRNEKNDAGIPIKDLPKDSADYLVEGYFDLKSQKYLEKILAPSWVNAFNETIKERDKSIAIVATMTGIYRPDFYNFETDHVKFDLAIPTKSLERIKKEVFEYEAVFEKYLREYNSSCSGFRSWMPKSIEEWRRYYYAQSDPGGIINPDSQNCKRAIIALLEFWSFGSLHLIGSPITLLGKQALPLSMKE